MALVLDATDEPARLMEIISPAGFEQFFVQLSAELSSGGPDDPAAFAGLLESCGLEMDFGSVPRLVQEHGLVADEVDQTLAED